MADSHTCLDGGRVRDRRAGADLQSQRHDGQVLSPPVPAHLLTVPLLCFIVFFVEIIK